MTEIYRHHDHARVGLLESLLVGEGIEVHLKNRNAATGIVEVPIPEFYPRLCIIHEQDVDRAVALLKEFLEDERRPLGDDWTCAQCQEEVPDSMGECWNCQAAKGPTSPTAAPPHL